MSKLNQLSKQRHRDFLLSFFDNTPDKQVKEINSFILVKYFDGNTKAWGVQVFTKESYARYLGQPTLLDSRESETK